MSIVAAHSPSTEASRSTVNADEIAHFSKHSSSWWDEQGEFAQLHRMNPIRVQFIREKLVSLHLTPKSETLCRILGLILG